jgi:hypothetical protein
MDRMLEISKSRTLSEMKHKEYVTKFITSRDVKVQS